MNSPPWPRLSLHNHCPMSCRSPLILSSHLYLCLQCFFPLCFSNRNYVFIISLMGVTCPVHPILCDVFTLIQFGEKYKLLSTLLYNFLHSLNYSQCSTSLISAVYHWVSEVDVQAIICVSILSLQHNKVVSVKIFPLSWYSKILLIPCSETPPFMFFLQCKWPSITHNVIGRISFVCFNLHIFWYTRTQKIQNSLVASIPQIWSALIVLVNEVLIGHCCFQISELPTSFKNLLVTNMGSFHIKSSQVLMWWL